MAEPIHDPMLLQNAAILGKTEEVGRDLFDHVICTIVGERETLTLAEWRILLTHASDVKAACAALLDLPSAIEIQRR